MRLRCAVILAFVVASLAQAAEQPEYPGLDLPETYTVVLKGRPLNRVFWRNGRPWGEVAELGPRLNLTAGDQVELDILAWAKTNNYAAELSGVTLTLVEPKKAYVPPPAWATPEMTSRPRPQQTSSAPTSSKEGPDLTYYIKDYVADTGYVRAKVVVSNEGNGASKPTRARAYFTDWFGKAFASDWQPIPALEPGESTRVMEFFSMVTEQEAKEKSMNYQVDVKFDAVTDPKTGRTTASQTKKSKLQQQMIKDKAKPTYSLPTKANGTP